MPSTRANITTKPVAKEPLRESARKPGVSSSAAAASAAGGAGAGKAGPGASGPATAASGEKIAAADVTAAPQKQETVSLIDEKKKVARPRPAEGEVKKTVLPPISRIKAPPLTPVAPAPEPPKVPAPATPVEPTAADQAQATPPVATEAEAPAGDEAKVIHIKPPIIVKDLAAHLGLKNFQIVKDLIEMNIFANINQTIEPDVATAVCRKHGFVFEIEKRHKGEGVHKPEVVVAPPKEPEKPKEDELKLRAPIVTFMGHVDHGKTTLMDYIRHAHVAAGEAGGITQHIGAYSVKQGEQWITFLDTPGHEAFTAMRARGANVTDIVVLVVAADDGLMPQTLEAISHARAAKVKIVVAITKTDLPGANVDKVKGQLQEKGLAPEDWGGEVGVCPVSALKGQGVDALLERILLEAEILELKASPSVPARGTVIEAQIEPGRGPTATVIVRMGTLRPGQAFICGNYSGKVKSLLNERGQPVKEAPPATPVKVLGFVGLPNAGDEFLVMDHERDAKTLSEQRLATLRKEKLAVPQRATLETIYANLAAGQRKVLNIVLKCDVQGSLEALTSSLNQIESKKIDLAILHGAVGSISDSDIMLACTTDNTVVIGFNVKVDASAAQTAKREGVQIKLYSIIYELIDQVKEAMAGMLEPEVRETVIGHAEVRKVFDLSKGKVAGCYVTDGRIARSSRARVLRGRLPIYDGGFATLRRFQDDAKEVRNGLECGIKLGDFNDYEPGDIIECYNLEKVPQKL